jgi:hypothetical protein
VFGFSSITVVVFLELTPVQRKSSSARRQLCRKLRTKAVLRCLEPSAYVVRTPSTVGAMGPRLLSMIFFYPCDELLSLQQIITITAWQDDENTPR